MLEHIVSTISPDQIINFQAMIDSPITNKVCKAIASSTIIFGAKYVSNDISLVCGNIMDSYYVKLFTIFCIMFQAVASIQMAFLLTIIFALILYYVKTYANCGPYEDVYYVDKEELGNDAKIIHTNIHYP